MIRKIPASTTSALFYRRQLRIPSFQRSCTGESPLCPNCISTCSRQPMPMLKGPWHWVNSLALSAENVLRTGTFDHSRKCYSTPEEMKLAALERYNKMKDNTPQRLVSGSDDFTMFMWEPAISKHP